MRTSKEQPSVGSFTPRSVGRRPHVTVWSMTIALVGLSVASGGAWTLWTQARVHREGEHRALVGPSATLAHSAEELLARGDVGGLQHVLSESAIEAGLEGATVTLDGVGVVADKALARVTVKELPGGWSMGDDALFHASAASVTEQDGVQTLSRRFRVEGKGDATLSVSRRIVVPVAGDFQSQVGIGAVGGGVLVVALLAYRGVRARMRGLGAIREVLHQASGFAPGELPSGAMRISEDASSSETFSPRSSRGRASRSIRS